MRLICFFIGHDYNMFFCCRRCQPPRNGDVRLYNAVCAWLEAQAAMMADDEQRPEGNNFTDAQVSTPLPTRPELHIGYGRQSGDDDDGGVYRVARPISMRWTP